MKKVFTFLLGIMFMLAAGSAFSQSLEAAAEHQTRIMNDKMKLNEAEYTKIKQFNVERLEKIAALSELREQDERYLNLRLDQIEEEYASQVFNTLNKKQYLAFMDYKKDQPYTYAGLTMKMNQIASDRPR